MPHSGQVPTRLSVGEQPHEGQLADTSFRKSERKYFACCRLLINAPPHPPISVNTIAGMNVTTRPGRANEEPTTMPNANGTTAIVQQMIASRRDSFFTAQTRSTILTCARYGIALKSGMIPAAAHRKLSLLLHVKSSPGSTTHASRSSLPQSGQATPLNPLRLRPHLGHRDLHCVKNKRYSAKTATNAGISKSHFILWHLMTTLAGRNRPF